MKITRFFLASLLAFSCSITLTSANTPLIFQQTDLTIVAFGPAPGTPVATPSDDPKSAPVPAPAPRQFKLRAQMRPAGALQQKDLFSVDPFARSAAHLFVFEAPTLTAFAAPSIQKPVDLIALDANGVIQEIVPKAMPSSLDATQYAVEQPVRALLILPAGTVDANGLRPGDKVQNAIFQRPPEKRR